MRRCAVAVAALLMTTTLSCTKSGHKGEDKKPYVVKQSPEPGLVAQFKDKKITEESLLERSGYLRDLVSEIEKVKIVMLYREAVNHLSKIEGDEKVALEFVAKEPKPSFEQSLTKYGIEVNPRIKVSFKTPAEGEPQGFSAQFMGEAWPAQGFKYNHASLYELENKYFDSRLKILNDLFTRRVIFSEAKDFGMPPENYIREKVLGGDITVTEKEVDEFIAKTIPAGDPVDENLRHRLEDILKENIRQAKMKAYAEKIFAQSPYEIYFSAPTRELSTTYELAPILGREEAPITVEVFAGFDCAECAEAVKYVEKLRVQNKYDVRLAFRHFFPEWKRESRMVAEASMCLKEQGDKVFWKFYDKFAESGKEPTEANINEVAGASGVDMDEFKVCFLNRKTKDEVAAHLDYAKHLGIRIQPTVVVEGKIFSGLDHLEDIQPLVEDEISKFGWKYKIKRFFHNLFN